MNSTQKLHLANTRQTYLLSINSELNLIARWQLTFLLLFNEFELVLDPTFKINSKTEIFNKS